METKTDDRGQARIYNREAEQALIGSMMQSSGVIDDFGWITPEHFWLEAHGVIYATMRDMHAVGDPVDLITLTERLTKLGRIVDAGGDAYVAECLISTPTSANADYYAQIVAEKALRRSVRDMCRRTLAKVQMDGADPNELLADAEAELLALRDGNRPSNASLMSLRDALNGAVDDIEKANRNRGKINGVATGFVDFDRCTTGLKGEQFVVIAARPGQGKTSFMMQAAIHAAAAGPVQVFSLEMGHKALATRLIASGAQVNMQRMRDGFLAKHDSPRIGQAVSNLAGLGLWIDSKPQLSIYEFRTRSREAVRQRGCRAIFVDYLQLMRSTTKRAQENRAIEIAEISMAMKATAKDLNVPVIACAQLNRDADKRSGPPKLSDLRESGQIEQDADIICFLHRPKNDDEDGADGTKVDLIVAKHRDGPAPTLNLRFIGEHTRFENVTEALYSNNQEKRQK